MSFAQYMRHLRRVFKPFTKRPAFRRYTAQLMLENLEDRVAPAGGIFPVLANASGLESIAAPKLAVLLNAPATQPFNVNYAVSGGTAVGHGTDFTLPNGTLSFPAGTQVEYLPLTIVNHPINEADKTIQITLSGGTGASFGTTIGTYTILNDVAAPTASFVAANGSGHEGTTGTFSVALSAASGQPISVNYFVGRGTATPGVNYKTASGTLTFTPGQKTKTISVSTLDDHLFNSNLIVQAVLTGAINATLGSSATATYTIQNIDASPTVAFKQKTGSAPAGQPTSLLVTLSAKSGLPVTVRYAAAGGTAQSGVDFTLPAGALTFTPGQTSLLVPLATIAQAATAGDKTVIVTLSNAVNAKLGTLVSDTDTIVEHLPTVGFTSSASRGPQTQNGSLAVALDYASTQKITVHYAVSGGTAGGADFKLAAGNLTLAAGQTTASIPFTVTNHTINEADKTIQVTLSSPSNAVLGLATTVYTIVDTVAQPSVGFLSANAAGAEGKTATLTVALSAASGQTVTVGYTIGGGTADAGINYPATPTGGTLTFKPGTKTQTITLNTLDDHLFDGNQTVLVKLANPTNASLGGNSVLTDTIQNIDPLLVGFQQAAASVTAGQPASLNVVLSAAPLAPVTVHYKVSGGTAKSGVDFTLAAGSLTFNPGQTILPIPLTTIAQAGAANKTVIVALSGPSGATLGKTASTTLTIVDKFPTVAFSSAAGSGPEGQIANLAVVLSAASLVPTTVQYAVTGGTAVNGGDYSLAAGSLTFAPGQVSLTIPIAINSQFTSSATDKTVIVTLSGPSGATLGKTPSTTYTILQKKPLITLDWSPPSLTTNGTPISTTNHNITLSGQVTDPFFDVASLQVLVDNQPPAPLAFDASGNFSFTTSFPLANQQSDGSHSITFQATDAAGYSVATPAITFTIDTAAPTAPTLDLAGGTADLGPETTSAARVTLVGQADPNIMLSLVGTGLTALTSATGAFQIPGVNLAPGANTLTVQAKDAAGNTSSSTLVVTRGSAAAGPNAVLVWNQATLNAIQTDGTDPLMSSRALAMVQAAVYDAVNNIEGTPAYYVKIAAPADASLSAAVDAAAHDVLDSLYPAQQATIDALLTSQLALLPAVQGTTDGEAVGQAVGNAIIAIRANDGAKAFVDFTPGSAPGDWQPTAPMYAPALDPQGANMTPWAMTSPGQFDPAGPPALSSQQWADAVNQVESLGAVNSTTRTAAETTLAQFWNDGVGTQTPSGHWNAIAQTVAVQEGDSLADDARLFAELDVSMADAGIATWNTKYLYDSWRPIEVIQDGADGVNADVSADPTWMPLLVTPNFPEYVSGHSTFSAAAATVLDSFFGDNVTFTTTEPTTALTETYSSFQQAALDAGMSRIYGGIHFLFSVQDGATVGQEVANFDLATFNVTTDTTPPKVTLNNVLPSGASKANVTITGQVTDNLSGVQQLAVQVDHGAYAPVSFNAVTGNFSFTTTFALNGTADGAHTLNFQATDAAGNGATPVPFTFTLATRAPTLTIASPAANGALAAGASLVGTVSTDAQVPVVCLCYAFDGSTTMIPVAFSNGSFGQALDLSKLGAGSHTLVVEAQDAAGNTTTDTLNLSLAAPIPLTVTGLTPMAGSNAVGVTFRPIVTFSRPIDTTTLSSANFYATDTSGSVVAATVVPADDGMSATMFFTNPLPGASTITLTVNGATIKAADGSLLDAAANGTPGSTLTSTFTTVSSAGVPGTSISGIVVDPGADGQPGTRDDVRSGADGILGDADDVYLNLIAGATVYILGQQNQAVISGADGSFSLTNIPAGDVKLVVDGNTATNDPAGVYYPEMVFDLTIQPGVANTVMGTMGTLQEQAAMATAKGVYLPRLQTSILQSAGGATSTTIALSPGAATSTLTSQQASEYSITVAPNSVVGMNGQKMSSAMIGVSTVAPSLIRDMLPPGVMQLATTLTIQAPGVATFTTPLQVTFANVYGAAPGTQLDVYSFNHTTGVLEITGTATVSPDGLTVTTDPNGGITHPGWFGVTPPGTTGEPEPCPEPPADTQLTAPEVTLDGNSELFKGWDDGTSPAGEITITNTGTPEENTSVEINITLSGITAFMTSFSDEEYHFELNPGDMATFDLTPRELSDAEEAALQESGLAGELLSGSIHIEAVATIYPPGTATCDADGNMITTDEPTSVETVLDQTLYYSELLTVDPNGLDFPVTDTVDSTDPQTITVTTAGPSQPTPTFTGDARVTQTTGGNSFSLTYTPDPTDTAAPTGEDDFTAPDSSDEGQAADGVDVLDFSPLAIRLSIGKIQTDDKVTKIDNAKLEIGLQGGAFQTLATFQGDFYADASVIKLNGTLTVNMEGQNVTLFDGLLILPRGQADGNTQGDGKSDQNAKVAGLSFQLSNIMFASGMLQLQGSVTLPSEWGAVTFAIDKPNVLQVAADGTVTITGGAIKFPDEKFSLFGLDIAPTGMQIRYQAGVPGKHGLPGTPDNIKISGDLTISTTFKGVDLSIDANLLQDPDPSKDNYLEVSATGNPDDPYKVDVKGQISFKDNFTIPPAPAKGFGITAGSLTVNTLTNAYTGSITLQLPGTSVMLTGTLGFLDGEINILGLKVDNINEGPLGEVPVWLQTIGMQVNNISDPATPVAFTGDIGFTLGPQLANPITITLPSWTGVKPLQISSLASLTGTATLDSDHIEGALNLSFLDPQILSGTTGTLSANWTTGTISIKDATLSALGGIVKATLNLTGSSATGLKATGVASINFPKSMPTGLGFLAGTSVTGTEVISIPSFTNLSQDYIAEYFSLPTSVPFIGKQAGFQIFFNGTFKLLGADDITALSMSGLQRPGLAFGPLLVKAANSGPFPVASGESVLILNSQWTQALPAGKNLTVVITDPNGNQTTLNTSNPTTTGPIQLVPALSSSTLLTVAIDTPIAGNWSMSLSDATGLGTVSFGALSTDTRPAAPTLQLTGPSTDTVVPAGGMLDVPYTASAPTPNTAIELFLDTSPSGYNGMPIASAAAVDGGGTIAVDTSTLTLATGDYYLYAIIDDGQNTPAVSNYAVGKISITDLAALPAVANVQAFWYGGGQEELTWAPVSGADHYLVTLTDTSVAGAASQSINANGPNTSILLSNANLDTPLVPGDSYSFQVQAISTDANGNFHIGMPGGQAVGPIGATPSVGPVATLTGEKFTDPGRTGVLAAGDTGLSGVTIHLVDAVTGTLLQSTSTDGQGDYSFGPLTPGRYVVQEVVDPARASDFPRQPGSDTVLVTAGATNTVNFGNPSEGSISGTVQQDTNFEGTADVPLAGVTVFLDTNGNGTLDPGEPTAVTDANGHFTFTDLLAGTYAVAVVAPGGLASAPAQSVTLAADQDAAGINVLLAQQLSSAPPVLSLLDNSGGLFRALQNDFGTVLADGPGNNQGVLHLQLANVGGQMLNVTGVTLADASGSFSVVGLAAGASVAPASRTADASAIPFEIVFDPTQGGAERATLTITTNDPAGPVTILLLGTGESTQQQISINVPNNNAGGLSVAAGPETLPNFGTVTNTGALPLTITAVVGDQFNVAGLPAGFGPGQPLVLAPGVSQTFSLVYTARAVGLERGTIQFLSNDPNTPALTVHVVGTGLPASGRPAGSIDNDYIAIDLPNSPSGSVLRGRTDNHGSFNFFLPANQTYEATIFDPTSGLIGHVIDKTTSSGQVTLVKAVDFEPSVANDTDGDGLPDDVEFAVGTNPNNAFTAGDGIDDFTHVIVDQTNALKGASLSTGVVATLPLNGSAQDITLVGSPNNSQGQTAYIATGSYGLAIVNVSNSQQPILLGQLQLAGNSTGIAVDAQLQIAAVAAGSALYLVDVSNSSAPAIEQTVGIAATAVQIADGIAYVANGNQVTMVDLITGAILDQETFSGGNVDDLSIAQGSLYVLASEGFASHTVYKLGLNDQTMQQPAYSLTVTGHPTFGRMFLFAGNGFVYVGASDNNNTQQIPGVEVIQDTGTSLTYVGPSSAITAFNVTVDSNGLALYCGGLQISNEVGLLDLSDPTNTDNVVTVFNTPGTAEAIAMGEGIAFVADGSAGLAVLNYLPFDTKGIAPTVSISLPAGTDTNTSTPGIQVVEGSDVPVLVQASDDVQVRNVELLVNGTVVQNAVSYPFDLTATLPTLAKNGSSSVTLQVEAIDTGGNIGLSNVITVLLTPESAVPLRIVSSNLTDGSSHGPSFQSFTFQFNKPVDLTTVTDSTFQLVGPSGAIPSTGIALRGQGQSLEIAYPSLPVGAYTLTIDAANVKDILGTSLGTTPIVDHFTISPYTIQWINTAGGSWTNPANWSTGVVPGPNDDVLIGVAGNPTITLFGTVTVRSLIVNDTLALSGGTLTMTAASQINGNLTLSGGTLVPTGGLTINGTMTWSGGTLAATGTIVNKGTITITGNGPLLAGTLTNQGSMLFTGTASRLSIADAANLNNQTTGIIDFQGGNGIGIYTSSAGGAVPGTLTNRGTIRRTLGTGTASLSPKSLDNEGGTIDVETANLVLNGTLVNSTPDASITVASGSILDLTSGAVSYTGTFAGTGAGTVRLNGSTLSVGAAGATFNFSGSLFQWNGGNINGPGVLTNAGTMTLNGGGVTLNGSITNIGTILETGSGAQLFISATGVLTNAAAGLIDLQGGDGTGVFNTTSAAGAGTLTNFGTIQRSQGTGTAALSPNTLDNQGGTIDLETANLVLNGYFVNSTAAGSISVASGSILDLTSGAVTYTGTFVGVGAGTVRLNSSTLFVGAAGATFNFSGTLFQWTAGNIDGPGVLTNSGTMTLSGGGVTLDGAITNTGTILETGASVQLYLSATGVLTNEATGLIDLQGGNSTGVFNTTSAANSGTLTNLGTIQRSQGTGTASLSPNTLVNQGGTINVEVANLVLNGYFVNSTPDASITVASGSIVDLTSGSVTYTGTYVGTGAGTVRLNGSNLYVGAAGATFNFSAGLFQWAGGNIEGPGLLTNTGTMTVNGGDVRLDGLINNTGTIVIAGGRLFISNPAKLTNATGGIVDFQGNDGTGIFMANLGTADVGTFTNMGAIRRTQGTGTAHLEVELFDNEGGTIDVGTTTLMLGATAVNGNGGAFTVEAGATLQLCNGGTSTYTGTFAGSGAGAVQFSTGNIDIGAVGATFNFTGGILQWSGGNLEGPGVLTNSGTLTVTNGDKRLDGLLTNTGTILSTGTADRLFVSDHARLVNQTGGIVDFQGNDGTGIFITNFGTGDVGTFTNMGTIRRTLGAGTAHLEVQFLDIQGGTIDVETSTLMLGSNAVNGNGATVTVAAGATLQLCNGGTSTYTGTFAGSGAGAVQFSTGNIEIGAVGATFNFTGGLLQWSGGNLEGPGVLTTSGTLTIINGDKRLDGLLTNTGTILSTGTADRLFVSDHARLVNQTGGTFDFQGNDGTGIFITNLGTPDVGTFTNMGTILRSQGTGTAHLEVQFLDNQGGTIDVGTSTLALGSNAVNGNGATFTAAAGATLQLCNGGTSVYTGTFAGSGAGAVQFSTGNIDIGTAGATFNFSGSLLQWSGGNIEGPGVLTSTGTMTFANGDKRLDGLLTNTGSILITGSSNRTFVSDHARLVNQTGGIVDFQGNDGTGIFITNFGTGDVGTFTNMGTIRRTQGTGTAHLEVQFLDIQGGTIDVEASTLALGSNAVNGNGATFTVAAGATLQLCNGGTSVYTGTFAGSGAGAVQFSTGNINIGAAGATFNFSGSLFQWSGGVIGGAGVLTNSGTGTLANGNKRLDTHLSNTGTIIESGNASYTNISDPGQLTNEVGGTFDFQGGDGTGIFNTNFGTGVPSTFINKGSILRSQGTGIAYLAPSEFDNEGGTIDVQTATLALQAGTVTNTGGAFNADGAGALELAFNVTTTYTGSFSGSGTGTVRLSGGTINIGAAGATFDFTGPLLQWTTGIISGTGALTNSGTLTLANGSKRLDIHLSNTGTILETGNADYTSISDPGQLTNQVGGLVDFQGGDGTGFFNTNFGTANQSTFINNGTLTRTQGTGTVHIDTKVFSNTGTMQISSGGLSIGSGFTNSGAITLGSAGTFTVNGAFAQAAAGSLTEQFGSAPAGGAFGKMIVTGAATFNGTLNLQLVNGYTPTSGDTFLFLTCQSESGTFSTVNDPLILTWTVLYDPTDLTAKAN